MALFIPIHRRAFALCCRLAASYYCLLRVLLTYKGEAYLPGPARYAIIYQGEQ